VPNLGQSVTKTAIRCRCVGRARIEGVAASIHESYVDAHGNKVAEDAVFKTPCVVIIFDKAPRYREVQSKPESKHPIMKAYRDRASRQAAGGDTSTNKICCSAPKAVIIRLARR